MEIDLSTVTLTVFGAEDKTCVDWEDRCENEAAVGKAQHILYRGDRQ